MKYRAFFLAVSIFTIPIQAVDAGDEKAQPPAFSQRLKRGAIPVAYFAPALCEAFAVLTLGSESANELRMSAGLTMASNIVGLLSQGIVEGLDLPTDIRNSFKGKLGDQKRLLSDDLLRLGTCMGRMSTDLGGIIADSYKMRNSVSLAQANREEQRDLTYEKARQFGLIWFTLLMSSLVQFIRSDNRGRDTNEEIWISLGCSSLTFVTTIIEAIRRYDRYSIEFASLNATEPKNESDWEDEGLSTSF